MVALGWRVLPARPPIIRFERLAAGKRKPCFELIAQEAEPLLPELVGEEARGYKTVRYNLLPPILLQGL
jgi:hypothetical protein